jgi:small subunit ribosomal protein S8
MHDPISDLLTRIRNAGQAHHANTTMPHSNLKEAVARILSREGYIADVTVAGDKVKTLTVGLKYEGRKPVFTGLRQVSTPGIRRYLGSSEIPRVLGGMGVAILSTSKGVMTGSDARRQNLGGELVCYVW